MSTESTPEAVLEYLLTGQDDLVRFRRDLHRNPETAWEETRTTQMLGDRLEAAGLSARRLTPTGLVVDLGPAEPAYRVGLRADIDALPIAERTDLPWTSRVPGVSHCCGHDVHTTVLLGAVLALNANRGELERRGLGVRAIFQPAEETIPGGALACVEGGVLDDVDAVFGLHCDPGRDVGHVGLRRGPITAACDRVTVRLTGRGGHTSRPHMTGDLTYALGQLMTDLPGALSRRLDPRAGAALVWGSVHAGAVANVIPDAGEVQGTLRILDASAWHEAGPLLSELVDAIVLPYRVEAELEHIRGVPPVVSSPEGVDAFAIAARDVLGGGSVARAEQSLGGEDFAWMLADRRGAFARLGTRTPGGVTYDLHRGDLVVDERAVGYGARLMAAVPFAAEAIIRRERGSGPLGPDGSGAPARA